jgi:cAMP-dependent protein kinase regulator
MTEATAPTLGQRPDRNSLDLALEQILAGQSEEPLRWVLATLEQFPQRVMAIYIAGLLLRNAQDPQCASRAFRVAVNWSVREGFLGRAAAAVCELKRMGESVEQEIRLISAVFSAESSRLLGHGAAPPSLVRSRLSINPTPSPLSEPELLDQLRGVIAEAYAQLVDDTWLEPLRVTPQPLFSSLDEAALRVLLNMLELRIVPAGTLIVAQDEPGEEMYVLARGEVEVSRTSDENSTPLARLGSGALFGEMALLSRTPRAAQVVASRPCLLLSLKKESLDSLINTDPDLGVAIANYCRRRMIDNLIRTSAVLRSVNARERPDLVQRFVTCSFEAGQRIIGQGEDPEGLHLIASGTVAVVHRDGNERTVIATLGVGEVVGEMSLVLRRPSSADVVATTPTVTLHLTSEQFLQIVRAYPGVLSHLYELAVNRDEETRSVLSTEAEHADDLILI